MTYQELLDKLKTLTQQDLIEQVVVEDITGTCILVKDLKVADQTHNYLYSGEYYLQLDDHIVTKHFNI